MTSPAASNFDHSAIVAAAVKRAGGVAELASAVGVVRSAISNWKKDGISVRRLAAVSRATGLPLHSLRPDLFDRPAADLSQQEQAA